MTAAGACMGLGLSCIEHIGIARSDLLVVKEVEKSLVYCQRALEAHCLSKHKEAGSFLPFQHLSDQAIQLESMHTRSEVFALEKEKFLPTTCLPTLAYVREDGKRGNLEVVPNIQM